MEKKPSAPLLKIEKKKLHRTPKTPIKIEREGSHICVACTHVKYKTETQGLSISHLRWLHNNMGHMLPNMQSFRFKVWQRVCVCLSKNTAETVAVKIYTAKYCVRISGQLP